LPDSERSSLPDSKRFSLPNGERRPLLPSFPRRPWPWVALGILFASAGCELTHYVAEQGLGQLRLLSGRERIADLLRRPDLPASRRYKLKSVLLARRYAFDVVGLRETGAYTLSYETHGRPIAHNVSAAAKDKLEPKIWSFPIVGSLPYIGFFRQERAQRLEARLVRQGYDTYLRPVSAFSSLGWFKDPVYSSMLEAPLERLIEIVLHETTHTTIFLRGKVGFNESLAVFVGQQATLDFLARLYGPLSSVTRRAAGRFAARRRFAALIEQLYRRLEELYDEPVGLDEKLRRRQQVFSWAKQRYRQLFPSRPKAPFLQTPLNNAVVLSHGRYLQGLRFHQAVYRCVARDLGRFVELYKRAQHFDDPLRFLASRCGLAAELPQAM
jgi:predicted aminopeptidase